MGRRQREASSVIADCEVKPVIEHQCRTIMHGRASSIGANDYYPGGVQRYAVNRSWLASRKQ